MGTVNDERSPMNLNRLATKRTLVVGAVVLAVCVGAGAAIAAARDVFDPEAEQEAFQAAVAEKLGVTTAELEDAYKEAALERLDAAVAAGRLTEEQADSIRARIESGDFLGKPAFGFGYGPGFGLDVHVDGGPGAGVRMESAADYLGLTEAEVLERLRDGKSLADIAKAEGKSVEGLKQALLAPAKAKLDNAVQKGEITSAQRDEILAKLESGIDDLVNGTGLPGPGPGFHHRFDRPMDSSFVPLAPDA
jgi:DNA-binding CsgD family transcriptional regulator